MKLILIFGLLTLLLLSVPDKEYVENESYNNYTIPDRERWSLQFWINLTEEEKYRFNFTSDMFGLSLGNVSGHDPINIPSWKEQRETIKE